ncbi:DNA helicase B isoform X1 [Hemiscyllium ocellatum]|uniref:DNA helicase B isoform X1 n=2 Tax=Hemiscyllium ocellatum TaxID=170820 RepID=UPI0029674626|nr:DNA helicase B isoform X1 [Hemiscyllium ocellatum]
MSRQRAALGKSLVVNGYFLPLKNDVAKEGSDTEEEEDDPQFLDLQDMMSVSDGAVSVRTSSVARRFVKINDLDSNRTYKVSGRFHFTGPWWKVAAKIKCIQKKWYLQCASYSLRSHLANQRKEIFSLFLTACNVHEQHKKQFIETLTEDSNLEFSNLLETLQRIADKEATQESNFAKSIIAAINSSVEGQYVQYALKFHNLMEILPKLLPRHFLDILMPKEENGRVSRARHILEELEQMIQTAVWKLGFSQILSKELQLIGCEASLLAFEEADLMKTIPELQRHALVIYDKLKQTCWSKGHTYVQVDELTALRSSEFSVQSAWESLKFLKDSKIIIIEKKRVYLKCFYNYEKEIASCIKELVNKPPWHISLSEVLTKASTAEQMERLPENTEHIEEVKLDSYQLKAAIMMCENPVTVISGKGGCGKTTLVSYIFSTVVKNMESADNEELLQACRDLEQDEWAPESWDIPVGKTPNGDSVEKVDVRKLSVLFTAPTGKAASLLKKKTGFNAYTLHQVMWNFWATEKSIALGKPHDWMFSDVQVLIVDEGSLVSVRILSTVLKLLMQHANLKKLIILGDVRQLPSIEPGNMLSDVYSSLYRFRWSIELPTNHRAESQLIIDNAAMIAEMGLKSTYKELQYDAVMHISKSVDVIIPTPDKKFILVSLPSIHNSTGADLQKAIECLLNSKAPGLDDDETSQFIAFRRADCDLINELCCKQYAGHSIRNHKNKIDFQVGDKVCCSKNGYVRDFTQQSEAQTKSELKEKRVRLCNGEIFFIAEYKIEQVKNQSSQYLLLDDKDSRQMLVNYKSIMKECRLQHAWAKTIHTFQGSEAATVVYVVGSAGRQNWQHIYTAVTRGRQRVYVVTAEDDFIKAVTAKSPHRNTRLRELLQEKIREMEPTSKTAGLLTQQEPCSVPSIPEVVASAQFDSLMPSVQVVDDSGCAEHNERRKDNGKMDPQEGDSFSADLAFAQDYSWSPQSLEFENRDCEVLKSTTTVHSSSLQTSGGTTSDIPVTMTGEEVTSSNKVSTPWSCGSKRIGNTVEDEKSPQKCSKTSLVESPLACKMFTQLALDYSPPRHNLKVKQLFKEEEN